MLHVVATCGTLNFADVVVTKAAVKICQFATIGIVYEEFEDMLPLL